MPEATEQQLEMLAPYLKGSKPDARTEMEMFCPLHNDSRKSAAINVKMGVWYCHAGCGGGSIRQLCDSADTWVVMEGRADLSITSGKSENGDAPNDPDRVEHLLKECEENHNRLMLSEPGQRRRLFRLRGINRTTIRQARIGFDGRYFKLPVFSTERELWNVRTYDPSPRFGRRKIWGVRGMNKGRLYPAYVLDLLHEGDEVLFCEGEWDALLALQAGVPAITTTSGAGKPWRPEWDVAFAGLRVFLCHDADFEGQNANRIFAKALDDIAEVRVCKLPYPILKAHGKDVTDFLIDKEKPLAALRGLMAAAQPYERNEDD